MVVCLFRTYRLLDPPPSATPAGSDLIRDVAWAAGLVTDLPSPAAGSGSVGRAAELERQPLRWHGAGHPRQLRAQLPRRLKRAAAPPRPPSQEHRFHGQFYVRLTPEMLQNSTGFDGEAIVGQLQA